MSKSLTRNELLMRISSEMSSLSTITPTNPMDQANLVKNAKDTERKLEALARVLSSMVPSYNYGGMDEARRQWDDYQERFYRSEPESLLRP